MYQAKHRSVVPEGNIRTTHEKIHDSPANGHIFDRTKLYSKLKTFLLAVHAKDITYQ
jgi:hypothetical protein